MTVPPRQTSLLPRLREEEITSPTPPWTCPREANFCMPFPVFAM